MGARAGIDLAIRWLKADPFERELYEAMFEKIVEKREKMDHNFAVDIANQIWSSVKF